jgi:Na+/melibiose symporter-like transporter
MFVPIYLVIALILLGISGFLSFTSGAPQGEGTFSGIMAVLGVVVMILTLLAYPLTRRRRDRK